MKFNSDWVGVILVSFLLFIAYNHDPSPSVEYPKKMILFEELKPQAEYTVVYNKNPIEFVGEINMKIDDGWIAIGNLSAEWPEGQSHQFHQAMVRLEE